MNDDLSADNSTNKSHGLAATNLRERLGYKGFTVSEDGTTAQCPASGHPQDIQSDNVMIIHPTDYGVTLECRAGCPEELALEGLDLSAEYLQDAMWEAPKDKPKKGKKQDPNGFPAPTAPLQVARKLLEKYSHDDVSTLRHWRETVTMWEGANWVDVEDAHLRREIYETLEFATYQKKVAPTKLEALAGMTEKYETTNWNPSTPTVNKVLDAMLTVQHLSADTEPQSWLVGPDEPSPKGTFISCENGLLRVEDRQLFAHTPRFFSYATVPFAYDESAPEPVHLKAFLENILEHDLESILTLQEFLGYFLSGRTDIHKIPLIVGPPRGGKGTWFRLVTDVVGAENVGWPTMTDLQGHFGLEGLMTKPLAIIADAGLSGNSREVGAIVDRIKNISGGDSVTVHRKFKKDYNGPLPTRFMVGANSVPNLPDESGAAGNRFIVIELRKTFLGNEDLGLQDRLRAELPSIFNWALDGLRRLNEQGGKFTVSALSKAGTEDMVELGSPVKVFVKEMCELDPEAKVSKKELYGAWEIWQRTGGHDKVNESLFGRNLKAAHAQIGNQAKITHPNDPAKRLNAFSGIQLKSDAGERASRVSTGDPEFWRLMAMKYAKDEYDTYDQPS